VGSCTELQNDPGFFRDLTVADRETQSLMPTSPIMLPVTTIYFDSSTAFLVTNNFMFASLLLVIATVTKWHSHYQFVFSHLQVCETTFAKIIFADREIKEHQHNKDYR